MAIPNLPSVPKSPTNEQLAQIVADGFEQIAYLLSGFLSSDNAREFGGWQIGKTELQSKDKTVGMSTNKVGDDPIRFFAGDTIDGNPKFKVTEAGILTAIAALFMSASGYPRVEMNSANGTIAAYQNAGNAIKIVPTSGPGTPALNFEVGGVVLATVQLTPTPNFQVGTLGSTPFTLHSGGDMEVASSGGVVNLDPWGSLQINGTSGYTGSFPVITEVDFTNESVNVSTLVVKKGIITDVL